MLEHQLQRALKNEAVQAIEYFRRRGWSGEEIAEKVEEVARSMRREESERKFIDEVRTAMEKLGIKFSQQRKDKEYANQLYGLSMLAVAFGKSSYKDMLKYLASLN